MLNLDDQNWCNTVDGVFIWKPFYILHEWNYYEKMSKIIYVAYVIIIRCYSNRNPQENTRKMTLSNVLRLFKNIFFLEKHYYDYCPIINTSNINKKFLFFTFCAFVDHKHLHTEGILRCNWGYPSCISNQMLGLQN